MKRYDYYKWKSLHGVGFYHVKKRGKWVKWKDVKKLIDAYGVKELEKNNEQNTTNNKRS